MIQAHPISSDNVPIMSVQTTNIQYIIQLKKTRSNQSVSYCAVKVILLLSPEAVLPVTPQTLPHPHI